MLELEKRASTNRKLSPSARARIVEAQKRRWRKIRETVASANRPPRIPQPPCSPLCDKLVKNIGRQFRDDEAGFVRQVQTSFANARVRKLTESDLGLMAGRGNSYEYWKNSNSGASCRAMILFLALCGVGVRRRNDVWPAFIDDITDFQPD